MTGWSPISYVPSTASSLQKVLDNFYYASVYLIINRKLPYDETFNPYERHVNRIL